MTNTLSLLLERLARQVHTDAHSSGLKPTQWEALRYLARANKFSRNPTALTAYLGITKGTVSQTLLALGRKGLIRKQIVKEDRREVKLTVTPKGQNLLKTHDPLYELNTAIASIPRQTQSHLDNALTQVLTTLLEQRQGRPFGQCKNCRYFRRTHTKGSPHFCTLLEEPLSRIDREQVCAEQEQAI